MQINSMTFTEFLIANGDESLVEYIENYVLQALVNQFDVTPRYWSKNNPPYEVDFIIQRENDIIPVEVKAETNIQSKSLKKYKELFFPRKAGFPEVPVCGNQVIIHVEKSEALDDTPPSRRSQD